MDDIDLLSSVLDKTGDIVGAVTPDQLDSSTPCPEYDVATLRDHIVGWIQVFEAGANERTFEGDAMEFHCGDDAEAEFRTSASSLVDAWKQHGLDREVAVS